MIQPKAVDGDGSANSWDEESDVGMIGVTAPGRYRFTFPAIEGYEPVPEQEVVVESGKITDHVIRLQKKP